MVQSDIEAYYLVVSIPHRKARNWGSDFQNVDVFLFQFLIGRLATFETLEVVEMYSEKFQFLIGRLATERVLSELSAEEIGFQFLIGRLATRGGGDDSMVKKESFNSS